MPQEPLLRVEGVNALIRNFAKIDRSISRGLQAEIRSVAQSVADEAKVIAAEKGLAPPGRSGRGTGALIKHIKTRIRTGSASVVEDVTRNGYPYARIYEYGHGGVRAFMKPAADKKAPEVMRQMEEVLDRILSGESFTN